ncbi:hypothetical protein L484_012325 [Morus notabilis]|uniref:Uncharacterized protein n=1 Tax=Morus notabilis TaxID=981085 RepID=W9S3C8_9ROSA|nr:hypothetical protein L484_012325 [Morus notabilis]
MKLLLATGKAKTPAKDIGPSVAKNRDGEFGSGQVAGRGSLAGVEEIGREGRILANPRVSREDRREMLGVVGGGVGLNGGGIDRGKGPAVEPREFGGARRESNLNGDPWGTFGGGISFDFGDLGAGSRDFWSGSWNSRVCPHHGYESWRLVSYFYEGLTIRERQFVKMMCNGEFLQKDPEEAFEYLNELAEKAHT